jgi:hypothetical protein
MMGVPKLAMTLFYLAYLAATFTSLHRAKSFRIKTTCDVHEHGKSLNGLCEKTPERQRILQMTGSSDVSTPR